MDDARADAFGVCRSTRERRHAEVPAIANHDHPLDDAVVTEPLGPTSRWSAPATACSRSVAPTTIRQRAGSTAAPGTLSPLSEGTIPEALPARRLRLGKGPHRASDVMPQPIPDPRRSLDALVAQCQGMSREPWKDGHDDARR
jgi:hypothetical protein